MTDKRHPFLSSLNAALASAFACAVLAFAAPARAQTPATNQPLKPENLSIVHIEKAIDKAIEALYKSEPTYTFPPEYAYARYYDQGTRNMMGNHALACWALLEAGETYQNPKLYRRINWVLSSDSANTYDRGMRATMLNQLPHQRWAPWIRRDAMWLVRAMTDQGNFTETFNGTKNTGAGDNANGQYGVLGLWNLLESRSDQIPNSAWELIDKYWREAQQKTPGEQAAGWGVYSYKQASGAAPGSGGANFYSRVSGPMTAGGVATLSITERLLYGPRMVDYASTTARPEFRKGMRWLDENFSINDKDEASDRFYYFWTVQRVGQATGLRTFNGIDWFRDITTLVINEQKPDGTWSADKGPLLSTGFALLYLSKANSPLSVSKIRFKSVQPDGKAVEAHWNNRPHDIWNFADFASEIYQYPTTWQITELSQPVYSLIESPILFVSTEQAFRLTDKEFDNLKGYIDAGGLLVTNQEASGPEAIKSFKDLSVKLFGREFEELKADHPFQAIYELHQPISKGVQMRVIHNGVRPLMIHLVKDLGRGLQTNDPKAEGFAVLSNLYLWVTGMDPRRSRLGNNFVTQHVANPTKKLLAARVKHNGVYDPEPHALAQLKALLANDFDIDMKVEDAAPSALGQHKVAFFGATADTVLTEDEAAAIRKWVEGGGTLWIDAVGGSDPAKKAALDAFAKIAPKIVPAPMARDNPIITGTGLQGGYDNIRVKYRLFALGRMGPTVAPRLLALNMEGRNAIILATEDLTCGLAGFDHWGVFGYSPEAARRLVINGVLQAMNNPTPDPSKPLVKIADLVARGAQREQPATPAPAPEAPAPTTPEAPKPEQKPAPDAKPATP